MTFTYLDSIIDKHGGTEADVKARIGKARGAFIHLENIWSSKVLSLHTKIRLGTKVEEKKKIIFYAIIEQIHSHCHVKWQKFYKKYF